MIQYRLLVFTNEHLNYVKMLVVFVSHDSGGVEV